MSKLNSIKQLEELSKKLLKDKAPKKSVISVSSGTCGQARGSIKLAEAFQEAAKGNLDKIAIKITGCHGFCAAEPDVIIYPEEIFYKNLKVEDAPKIVEAVLKNKILMDLTLSKDGKNFVHVNEIPFYNHQNRILLKDNPLIDPTKIEDYIAIGGYKALSKALQMKPEEIIDIIKRSGLRGRGGAGFPTGRKWEVTRGQKNDVKYIICNADEGDPGAYMDRSQLEGNPQSILEGMIIGAYAMRATKGWVYVRTEYPIAVQNVLTGIKQMRDLGLLGENILGSGFNFDIEEVRGAGAFVCGEETALIHSIESMRGIPSQRPPFPAQKGLFGKPTNINNVETWANVPKILINGADWFANIGTKTSKGTKIFSLVGKVKNTGLVEVPMGITLQEMVYDIGEGSPKGKKIKAVQIGGPSGGCIPENLFHLPVDYESLSQAGSIMGSGGMIVLDEETCMVDFAKYFMNFLQNESCGNCSSCREGTQRMYQILTDITEGKGDSESMDLLVELGTVVKDASLCGLGQTAPNPVLSTIRYYKDEYDAHINEKRCPAGVCKALIKYLIDQSKCTGCGLCSKNCPSGAISGELKQPHTINQEKCIRCGVCRDVCKFDSVTYE
jgi:NADH:ubiquinone oxidoreductase subunit F (NADH-binding)/(2Fe-2S) ferredoxin